MHLAEDGRQHQCGVDKHELLEQSQPVGTVPDQVSHIEENAAARAAAERGDDEGVEALDVHHAAGLARIRSDLQVGQADVAQVEDHLLQRRDDDAEVVHQRQTSQFARLLRAGRDGLGAEIGRHEVLHGWIAFQVLQHARGRHVTDDQFFITAQPHQPPVAAASMEVFLGSVYQKQAHRLENLVAESFLQRGLEPDQSVVSGAAQPHHQGGTESDRPFFRCYSHFTSSS